MKIEKPFVYVHIEKTAGTSVNDVLIDTFGKDRLLRYSAGTDTVIRLSDRLVGSRDSLPYRIGRRIVGSEVMPKLTAAVVRLGHDAVRSADRSRQQRPERMTTDFDVLFGHFAADRFTGILPPEDYNYTTVLREPLARMRSHYEHWRRTKGIHHFRVRPPFDPETTFEEFALLPEMRDYQTQAVGPNEAGYHTIGVVDYLPAYLEAVGWATPETDIPRVNVGSYAAQGAVDPGFYRDFVEAQAQDLELYERVRSGWQS